MLPRDSPHLQRWVGGVDVRRENPCWVPDGPGRERAGGGEAAALRPRSSPVPRDLQEWLRERPGRVGPLFTGASPKVHKTLWASWSKALANLETQAHPNLALHREGPEGATKGALSPWLQQTLPARS